MKMTEYSIDDLHAMATAELEQDADAVARLHALCAQLQEHYIAAYTALRKEAS